MKVTNKNRASGPKLTVVQPVINDNTEIETTNTEPRRDNKVHVPRLTPPDPTLNPRHFKYVAAAVAAALAILLIL